MALTGAAAGAIVLERGFHEPVLPLSLIHVLQAAFLVAYWASVFIMARRGTSPAGVERVDWVDYALLGGMSAGVLAHLVTGHRFAWMGAEAAVVALFMVELWRLNVALSLRLRSPGVLLPASFLTLIVINTVLLKTPVATPQDQPVSWVDALFTATSAVCVTGLVVRDTATGFTPLGQTFIAIFMQLGGLGFIIFGSTLAMLIGRSLTVRGTRDLSQMLADEPVDHLRRYTRFILLSTLGIELVGAVMMYPLWEAAPGAEPLTPARRAALSAFHSISAFCNAGFDITGESMVPYRYSFLSHGAVATLVILGGIGYPVLSNLARAGAERGRRVLERLRAGVAGPFNPERARLTLHTKIVLVTSLVVYLYGVVSIAAGQLMPWIYRTDLTVTVDAPGAMAAIVDAHFMSLTARTAGFTTVPMSEIEPAGRFSLITLMAIGGAPGGSAGGVKVTVLALLVASVVSTIRQRPETEAFKRTISDALVRRAGTIAACFFMVIVVATLLLSASEGYPLHIVLFEATSAAATTGLSLGLTPVLTPFGKVVIIVTMFLGRVGPLALFGALVLRRGPRRPYAYAHEAVALG